MVLNWSYRAFERRFKAVLLPRNCHVKLSELWDAQQLGGEASDKDTARWYRAPELILNNDRPAVVRS